jgi:hypothetical protein
MNGHCFNLVWQFGFALVGERMGLRGRNCVLFPTDHSWNLKDPKNQISYIRSDTSKLLEPDWNPPIMCVGLQTRPRNNKGTLETVLHRVFQTPKHTIRIYDSIEQMCPAEAVKNSAKILYKYFTNITDPTDHSWNLKDPKNQIWCIRSDTSKLLEPDWNPPIMCVGLQTRPRNKKGTLETVLHRAFQTPKHTIRIYDLTEQMCPAEAVKNSAKILYKYFTNIK